MYNLTDEQVNHPKVLEWIEEAPVGVLEHPDYFEGETKDIKDKRMECNQVYQGDIVALVDYLREIDDSYKLIPSWNLICKLFNEISPIDDVLSRLVVEGKPTVEELLASKEVAMVDPETSKTIVEETTSTSEVSSAKDLKENVENTDLSNINGSEEPVQLNMELPQESKTEESTRAGDNNFNFKEDSEMGVLDNVVKEANNTTVNTSKAHEEGNEAAQKAQSVLAATKVVREDFTKNNKIQQFVVANDSTANRIVNGVTQAMVAINAEDCAKRIKTMKINFLKAIGVAAEEAKGLKVTINSVDDIMKYQNKEERRGVYSKADAEVAYKVWLRLVELTSDPTQLMTFAPLRATDYKVVGANISGRYYDYMGLINLVLTKSMGTIYAVNAIGEDGMVDSKKATYIRVKTVEVKGKKDEATGQETKTKKLIPTFMKKAEFVKTPSNVLVAHPTSTSNDVKEQKTVQVTFLVDNPQQGAEPVEAKFSYFNDSPKATIKTVKDSKGVERVVYPKRTFKLTGRVKTYTTSEAPLAILAEGEWGTAIKPDSQTEEKGIVAFEVLQDKAENDLAALFGQISAIPGIQLDDEVKQLVTLIQTTELKPAEGVE